MTTSRFSWFKNLTPRLFGKRSPATEIAAPVAPPVAAPAARSAARAAAKPRKGEVRPIQLRTIPREEHGISRKQISPNALRVLYKLKDGGFSGYIVGGAVRDLLLGIEPKDFDVATDATPEQIKRLFRNCRLIGRRFRLAHIVYGSEIIEVATFRASTDDGSGERHMVDGRIVRDNVYGSLEDDALRRDFTVNALYYTIEDFSVRDYVGGYEDVRSGVLRLIGDVDARLTEDPVRMLRAVRLAAKLGLRLDDKLAAAIPRLAPLIAGSAPARLFDELLKLFMSGHAGESFKGLTQSGLLREFLPESAAALQSHGAGAGLIEAALASTDARIAADKPVTPAFLLAALLWPAARSRAAQMLEAGADPQLAWVKATTRVLTEQCERIALPRRFTAPMQEIWLLQFRFAQLSRKKVMRLLSHPRFRAAYDFLLLRASEEKELLPLARLWEKLQGAAAEDVTELLKAAELQIPQSPDGAIDALLDGDSELGEAGESATDAREKSAAPGRPKRRRRRRRKPAGAKPPTAEP